MKILGISGSLRKDSYNTALLDEVKKNFQDGIDLEVFGIGTIPFYNEDIDGDEKPESVQKLLDSISSADAILFSTPEFNHGIPGVLKNAIDWASRPAFKSPLLAKPCGIISASMSPVGGARVQAELKTVLSSTLSLLYPSIEYLLPNAHEMFNESGGLCNAQAERRLHRYCTGFIKWAKEQH